MILDTWGKLSEAQTLAAATPEASTNQINIGALGIDGPGPAVDVWLDIETAVVVSGNGALTIDLRLATSEALTTYVNILSVVIVTGSPQADKRLTPVGAKILRCTLPYEAITLARLMGATYKYLGIMYTPTSTLAMSINASISPTKPRTDDNVQVITSNVGVPT